MDPQMKPNSPYVSMENNSKFDDSSARQRGISIHSVSSQLSRSDHKERMRHISRSRSISIRANVAHESMMTHLDGDELEGWRHGIARTIESALVHTIVLVLILVDLGVVIAEMSITILHDSCETTGDHHGKEPLSIQILSIVSLVIVSIFAIEVVLKLIVFGYKYFTNHWLHAFDAFVIVSTLVLLITLHGKDAHEVAGLLIVFRFWRIVRIIDAVAITAAEKYEREIEVLQDRLAIADSKVEELKQK